MEDHHLLRPLLPTSAVAATVDITVTTNAEVPSPNSKTIQLRLLSVAVVGILSMWANHEASKGFRIDVENTVADSASASRQFDLLYVSNDKATRLVLSASNFVEMLLYPNSSLPKKQVNHVTLRLGCRNLSHVVVVESTKEDEFSLQISSSTMEEIEFVDLAMLRAVQKGMAFVWLYNNAPNFLINGMAEYITSSAGLGPMSGSYSGDRRRPESGNICWMDGNPAAVAHFLNFCEEHRRGFIQRLNQAMRCCWHDRMVDDALGMPAQHLCASYTSQSRVPNRIIGI